MIATTLHSIAVGNLLPAWVKVVCVDINPSTVIKLSDRGSFQTVGLVTDVEPFLRALVEDIASARTSAKCSAIAERSVLEPSPRIAAMPHILMCPPDYYGIEYEINPWMSRQRQSDRRAAVRAMDRPASDCSKQPAQRSNCCRRSRACPTWCSPPTRRMIYRNTPCWPAFAIRSGKAKSRTTKLARAPPASKSDTCPSDLHFEGAGDALFCGDTLFAGYRMRSDARGHQQIGEMLGCRVIPLELVDPYYYHLDTCFCPLAPGEAIYYPPAFDDYGRAALKAHVPKLIEVSADEAQRFACNAVVVGRTVITNTGCPKLARIAASARLYSASKRRSTNSSKPAAAQNA